MTPKTTVKPKRKAVQAGKEVKSYWTPTARYFFLMLVAASISIWIRSGFPVYAIGNSEYDDLLFVRLADSLGSGNWLGPYSQFTLAKGMFYSLFIAIAHFFHVPLKIAEQIVYLVACGLAAELVRRRTQNNYLALVLFALLAFNPALWNNQLARVIREALYVSLSLTVVVLFVLIVFPRPAKDRHRVLYGVVCGASLGLIAAAYWLTREEGFWLVPALAAVSALGAAKIFSADSTGNRDKWKFSYRPEQIKQIAWPLALAVLTFLAGDFLVAGLNYQHYGIFETNEFRSKSFVKAYGALTRIWHDQWQQYVLFPKDARERAYVVSSAARELKPSFEGPDAEPWRQTGCSTTHISPCPEVLAGWFMWEFRDAVQNAGHYKTATEAMRFYDTLANQINEACAKNSIPCLPQRDSLSPPFRWQYVGQSFEAGQTLAKLMFTLKDGPVGTLPSRPPLEAVSLFSRIVGKVSTPEEEMAGSRVVLGWAGALSGTPVVQLVSSQPEGCQSSTRMGAGADLAAQYPSLNPVRFRADTDCPPLSADLVVEAPRAGTVRLPLAKLTSRGVYGSPAIAVVIDANTLMDTTALENERQSLRVQSASVLSWGYAIGLPILSLLGALGLLAAVFKGLRIIPMEILALGLASAVAVGTRIVLLAYITATSFPAANLLYSAPASPFVIMFAVIGLYCGYLTLRTSSHQKAEKSNAPLKKLPLSRTR